MTIYTISVWRSDRLFFTVDKDSREDAIDVGRTLRDNLNPDGYEVSILKWTSVGPSDLQRERVDF